MKWKDNAATSDINENRWIIYIQQQGYGDIHLKHIKYVLSSVYGYFQKKYIYNIYMYESIEIIIVVCWRLFLILK